MHSIQEYLEDISLISDAFKLDREHIIPITIGGDNTRYLELWALLSDYIPLLKALEVLPAADRSYRLFCMMISLHHERVLAFNGNPVPVVRRLIGETSVSRHIFRIYPSIVTAIRTPIEYIYLNIPDAGTYLRIFAKYPNILLPVKEITQTRPFVKRALEINPRCFRMLHPRFMKKSDFIKYSIEFDICRNLTLPITHVTMEIAGLYIRKGYEQYIPPKYYSTITDAEFEELMVLADELRDKSNAEYPGHPNPYEGMRASILSKRNYGPPQPARIKSTKCKMTRDELIQAITTRKKYPYGINPEMIDPELCMIMMKNGGFSYLFRLSSPSRNARITREAVESLNDVEMQTAVMIIKNIPEDAITPTLLEAYYEKHSIIWDNIQSKTQTYMIERYVEVDLNYIRRIHNVVILQCLQTLGYPAVQYCDPKYVPEIMRMSRAKSARS